MRKVLIKCPSCQKESIMYVPYSESMTTTDSIYIKQRYSLDNKCNCKSLNEEVLREFNKLPLNNPKSR